MIEESRHWLDIEVGMKVYGRPDAYLGESVKVELSPTNFMVFEVGREGEVASPLDQETSEIVCKGREYLEYVMCKIEMPTIDAVRGVEKALTVKVNFAGLKDTNAFTCQFITMRCSPGRRFRTFYMLHDGRVRLYYRSRTVTPLRRGDLEGNLFEVFIEIGSEADAARVRDVVEEVLPKKPFPNFYGYQRFGVRRPTTHKIGRYVIEGKWSEAVNMIIGHPLDTEPSNVKEARKLYDEGRWRDSLRKFPKGMWIERKVLSELVKGTPPRKALMSLGPQLLRLYAEAFQAYLFNISLSDALITEGSVEKLMSKCEVFPLPYPGLGKDPCSAHILKAVREFGISEDAPGARYLRRGVRDVYFMVEAPKFFQGEGGRPSVRFKLKPSVYATVMLRELVRTNLTM